VVDYIRGAGRDRAVIKTHTRALPAVLYPALLNALASVCISSLLNSLTMRACHRSTCSPQA
jgi:hypothetical protein